MRATFEQFGVIFHIGNDLSGTELDTTDTMSGCYSPQSVCIAIYQRDIDNQKVIRHRTSVHMKPSEARAMASALLSAATEARP